MSVQSSIFEQIAASASRELSDSIKSHLSSILEELASLHIAERVSAINDIRRELHEISPFKDEPVDCVLWVPGEGVSSNDYNPNSVAPPEMKLLETSILQDGYTQPIVTFQEESRREVVDGFHRNRVGKECEAVRERVMGYLPVVTINEHRTDKGDRIAATIRHNRARGKHRVDAMSEIVVELKRRNWSEERIGKELGMDPDEVLRFCQISGLAEMFANKDFSEAWEHTGPVEQGVIDADGETVNLEWMNEFMRSRRESGWHDRTESSSVLYGEAGRHLGTIQKNRFKENEWFWYAYTVPMKEGRSENREMAKQEVETQFT